jgi:hypothetical protein
MRRFASRVRMPEELAGAAQRLLHATSATSALELPAALEGAACISGAVGDSGVACKRWQAPRPWLQHAAAGSTTSDIQLVGRQTRHFLGALTAPASKVHQERRLIG